VAVEPLPASTASRVLTRSGWTLLGASAGLLVAGRMLGTVELAMLATGALALLAWAVLVASVRRVELRASRTLRPARLEAGAVGRVDLLVRNEGRRTTPQLSVTDPVDGGRRAARLLLPPLAPGASARAAYRLPTPHRGRHRVGPLLVAATDPFGLACRTLSLAGVDTVTVYPRLFGLVPPTLGAGGFERAVRQLRSRAVMTDAADDFLTLRKYEAGDDLRRVHWRSSARAGELMVRQDEVRRQNPTVVVLDVRGGAHDRASFERAVEVTASLFESLTRLHRPVEVVTSAGETLTATRTDRSGTTDARVRLCGHTVLEALAVLQPGGNDRIAAVLATAAHRASLVVVVVGGVTIETLATLGELAARQEVVVAGTRGGPLALAAATEITHVDVSQPTVADAWNGAMAARATRSARRFSASRRTARAGVP